MKINLQKISYNVRNKLILDDFTYSIDGSRVIGIVGPSGAGKTTLLKIIAGLINPSSGQIRLEDIVLSKISVAQRPITYLQQTFPLYEQLTVFENILISYKTITSSVKDKAEYYLNEMLLHQDLWKRKPQSLSGGEKQRVAFIKAIMKPADIYLMDEPFSNLDKFLKSKASSILIDLIKEKEKLCFYVSHDENEVTLNSDTLIFLDNGRIVQADESEKLISNPVNSSIASFGNSLGLQIIDIEISPHLNFFLRENVKKIAWLPHKSILSKIDLPLDYYSISFPVKVLKIIKMTDKRLLAIKPIEFEYSKNIILWHQDSEINLNYVVGSIIWISINFNNIFQLDINNNIIK